MTAGNRWGFGPPGLRVPLLGVRPGRSRLLGPAAAVAAAGAALWVAVEGGVEGPSAAPDVLRAAAAAIALFGLAGYAPARLLAPGAMRPQLALVALPLGAVCSSIALTALGLLGLPFDLALVALLLTAAGSAVMVRVRRGPANPQTGTAGDGERLRRLAWPLYVAILVTAITLVPVFRSGFATVMGQNGDAYLAVGSAELLQRAAPTGVEPTLPVDRVPLVWRSKYPIYYSLAAVSSLSGLSPLEAFHTLGAIMLALTALGYYLLARRWLGAGPVAALLVMALVPLDRIAVHAVLHPFYNQVWGEFALPYTLLFGLNHLNEPSRSSAVLLGLFAAIGAFAHPLMLFFPAVALAAAGCVVWRRRRAAGEATGWMAGMRLPRTRRSLLLAVTALLVAVPLVTVLVRGVAEKVVSAGLVLLPWRSLEGWGSSVLDYLPFARFFGMPDSAAIGAVAVAALLLAAIQGLRESSREAAAGLGALVAVGIACALSFRLRDFGELFYFKTLSYLGPLVLALAVTGLAGLARRGHGPALRAAASGTVVAIAVALLVGVRSEVRQTDIQVSPALLELRSWSERLPPGSSVRIDLPPTGAQLWVSYMLFEHPQSSTDPIGARAGFFPYPPIGRRADHVIVDAHQPRPADALGIPILQNAAARLYRMRPGVPGRDVSSIAQVDPVKRIKID